LEIVQAELNFLASVWTSLYWTSDNEFSIKASTLFHSPKVIANLRINSNINAVEVQVDAHEWAQIDAYRLNQLLNSVGVSDDTGKEPLLNFIA
jgi:hypothetical protein